MVKRFITKEDLDRRIRKEYGKSRVSVRLGELDLVLKAAKRCLRFSIMNDTYLGGGLTVEDEEMARAFKSMSEYLKDIREQTLADIERKLNRKFTTKVE